MISTHLKTPLPLDLQPMFEIQLTLVIETYSQCYLISTTAAERPSLKSDVKRLR